MPASATICPVAVPKPASSGPPGSVRGGRGGCGGTGRTSRAMGERIKLFEQALGIEWPWYVERTEFDAEDRRLDVHLNFEVGGTFACAGCGAEGCKAYDTKARSWHHMDFFQYQAYLHAHVPRVRCAACGIRQARLSWARPRGCGCGSEPRGRSGRRASVRAAGRLLLVVGSGGGWRRVRKAACRQ